MLDELADWTVYGGKPQLSIQKSNKTKGALVHEYGWGFSLDPWTLFRARFGSQRLVLRLKSGVQVLTSGPRTGLFSNVLVQGLISRHRARFGDQSPVYLVYKNSSPW